MEIIVSKILEFFKALFSFFSKKEVSLPPKGEPLVIIEEPKDPSNIDAISADNPHPWFDLAEMYLGTKELLPDGKTVNPLITFFFTFTSYKTQKNEPWCAAFVSCMLRRTGYKDTNSAKAFSYNKYGKASDLRKGAGIVIEHPDLNHHVTFFSHWSDQKKGLAMCLGGNQSNMVKYTQYNFNVDKPIRVFWPIKL